MIPFPGIIPGKSAFLQIFFGLFKCSFIKLVFPLSLRTGFGELYEGKI